MKQSIKFISILSVLSQVPIVQACNYYPHFENGFSFAGTITVPGNLPVGGLIARAPVTGSVRTGISTCPTPITQITTGRFKTFVTLPGLRGVHQTNVEGVGMLIRSSLHGGIAHFHPMVSSVATLRPERYEHTLFNTSAEFYKIGPVSAGTIPSGNLQEINWDGRKVSHFRLNTAVRFVTPTATCDLATGDVNRSISLDPVQVSAFKNAITAGARNFEIAAHCTNAANVTFRFSGTPAPGNDHVFANTGTADGIALRLYSRIGGGTQNILANGTENTRTVAVSGAQAVLPLGAAYHKNGTVRPGTLASTATVNITYD
ncbi:hypothetical protein PspS35_01920 [Pseudomonas sp. S35]|uniref:fimbrial protein n=1 Tax=Pseudomonas sp. S35 TaxID=1573719 RepID=UPI00132EBCF6|nr:fimbrial protein [Pseudomonas sp. S35]QHF42602.1 hypothetical protein PspS35_01920 [Pseudomonas sp. S35]